MAIPRCPAVPTITQTDSDTLRLPITLVTPMFGGGTKTRTVDKYQPIRPTSIRGHLQFWWRATAGARHTQSQSLFADQADIWGSTSIKSKVSVSVEATVNPAQISYTGIVNSYASLKYALFPFAANQGATEETGVKQGFNFTVTIKRLNPKLSDQQWQEVKDATTAWINFGGVGSRTRRGCGSLFSDKISFSTVRAANTWLQSNGTRVPKKWPTLSTEIIGLTTPMSHMEAWENIISHFSVFRQGRNVGRNPGTQRPGQSRFPDPDTIRSIMNLRDHELRGMPQGFPRAEFGLPIIFQRMGPGNGPTLVPDSANSNSVVDRMASPLVLKPMAVSESQSAPIIARFNNDGNFAVCLRDGLKRIIPNSQGFPVRSDRFASINPSPMNGFSSAIDAFLAYAKNKGYTSN